jgi:hypothetical protein
MNSVAAPVDVTPLKADQMKARNTLLIEQLYGALIFCAMDSAMGSVIEGDVQCSGFNWILQLSLLLGSCGCY